MTEQTNNVVNLRQFKAKLSNARYYWNMTLCTHLELAKYMGIPVSTASRWCIKFNKERNGKK